MRSRLPSSSVAAAMLPSKVSAKVNGTGSSSSNHITWKGQTLWGYATRGEKSGTAKTTFTATAGLTAHVKLEFNIPSDGPTASSTTDRKETNSGTTVTAICVLSGLWYCKIRLWRT